MAPSDASAVTTAFSVGDGSRPSTLARTDTGSGADRVTTSSLPAIFGVRLTGGADDPRDEHDNADLRDTLLLLFNAHHESIRFSVSAEPGKRWARIFDTAQPDWKAPLRLAGRTYDLSGRSVAAFLLEDLEPKKRRE